MSPENHERKTRYRRAHRSLPAAAGPVGASASRADEFGQPRVEIDEIGGETLMVISSRPIRLAASLDEVLAWLGVEP